MRTTPTQKLYYFNEPFRNGREVQLVFSEMNPEQHIVKGIPQRVRHPIGIPLFEFDDEFASFLFNIYPASFHSNMYVTIPTLDFDPAFEIVLIDEFCIRERSFIHIVAKLYHIVPRTNMTISCLQDFLLKHIMMRNYKSIPSETCSGGNVFHNMCRIHYQDNLHSNIGLDALHVISLLNPSFSKKWISMSDRIFATLFLCSVNTFQISLDCLMDNILFLHIYHDALEEYRRVYRDVHHSVLYTYSLILNRKILRAIDGHKYNTLGHTVTKNRNPTPFVS